MSALAAAAVASLAKGALVAAVVAAIGWAWRAEARVQSGLATFGLWIVALWFLADVWVGLADAGGAVIGPAWSAPRWLGWVWGVGVALGWARMVVGGRTVRRWQADALPLSDAVAAVQRWRGLARTLRLRVVPRFAVSRQIVSPMVVGVLAPCVLVPAAILAGQPPALTAAQLDALIAHELAHLARADPWLSAVQGAIEIVLFHNPAVWWLGRRARRFREAACDDLAIAAGAPRMTYARALLAVAQLDCDRRNGSIPAAALAASNGRLTARIDRIVVPRPGPRPVRAAIVAAACTLAIAFGSLRSAPTPAPAREGTLQIAWLPDAVRAHQASILAAAQRHGVDPNLIAIVTMVESGGDPTARSAVGAAGLMQLMPATAARAAGAQGLPAPTPERLSDPAYNVELGTTVLAEHLAAFGGDSGDPDGIARAAAAYNAGPQRVRAWLQRGVPLPEETQRYQAKVVELWARRAEPMPTAGG